MSTKSYANARTIEKEIEYLGHRLDKYAKFYWRGEDMWETYHTFITNNGSALKFVNGPSFTNEYSSPQYDHATGNLTGVKFSRMQVNFTICSYGVTIEQYRKLISALGPYEIDYLAFDYDNKLCYLAKTIGMKEAVKYVVGTNKDGKDLYLVENTVTFEVQGEQCAIAQRQYVWTGNEAIIDKSTNNEFLTLSAEVNSNDMLEFSELSFGVVAEVTLDASKLVGKSSILNLYIAPKIENEQEGSESEQEEEKINLCSITLNAITANWIDTTKIVGKENPQSLLDEDKNISIKYDSVSGLVFLQYGEADYKILNLLLTNTAGEYLISGMKTEKMKIEKNMTVKNIVFIWECEIEQQQEEQEQEEQEQEESSVFNIGKTKVYGRAKTILV